MQNKHKILLLLLVISWLVIHVVIEDTRSSSLFKQLPNPRFDRVERIGSTSTEVQSIHKGAERAIDSKYVFLAGVHNSGTSLVNYCLMRHPQITGLTFQSFTVQNLNK